jgi:small subunit ribosomal protein S6e
MKVVIADPKKGRCYQIEIDETKSKPLHGCKIGDSIEGALIGLAGYKFQITGGTDKDGFPMRQDVSGLERKKILLSSGPGFKPKEKGERRRKTVRGNLVAEDIAQLNVVVMLHGEKGIAETFGIVEKVKEKKPKEEKKEEKPAEEEKAKEQKPEKKEKPKAEKEEEKPAEEKKSTKEKSEKAEKKMEKTEKAKEKEEKK